MSSWTIFSTFSLMYSYALRKVSAIKCHILTIVNISCSGSPHRSARTRSAQAHKTQSKIAIQMKIFIRETRKALIFARSMLIWNSYFRGLALAVLLCVAVGAGSTAKRKIRDELKEMEATHKNMCSFHYFSHQRCHIFALFGVCFFFSRPERVRELVPSACLFGNSIPE